MLNKVCNSDQARLTLAFGVGPGVIGFSTLGAAMRERAPSGVLAFRATLLDTDAGLAFVPLVAVRYFSRGLSITDGGTFVDRDVGIAVIACWLWGLFLFAILSLVVSAGIVRALDPGLAPPRFCRESLRTPERQKLGCGLSRGAT